MSKEIYLSVIIPAYNEKKNFQDGTLDQVWQYLKKQKYSWETLVVDDGSTDGSAKLLKHFCQEKKGFRFIQNPHMGKAGAVTTGVHKAKGEYLLFTDFDQATPLSEFEKLQPYLKRGCEVVIGSREVAGAKREQEPFYRHLMGKVFNLIVQVLTVRGIIDTQCGFKVFKRSVAKHLFQNLQIYKPKKIKTAFTGAFDVELLYLAKKFGYGVAEVPIHWKHIETNRVNPIRDSFLMAWDVLRIRIYDWLRKYK